MLHITRDDIDTEVIKKQINDDCFDTSNYFNYNEDVLLNALTLRNEIMQFLK